MDNGLRSSKGFKGSKGLRGLMMFVVLLMGFCSSSAQKKPLPKTGTLKISFVNRINDRPVVLLDSNYTNPFGEPYAISKLRYYISNISLKQKTAVQKEKNSYHLLDESKPASLTFDLTMKAGDYSSVDFLIGVDSTRNCSGAQTGALDPMNDMFWTWNSGYVMFKLEGVSPLSSQYNRRIEYHIGGFTGENNVLKKINLPADIKVVAGKTTELVIAADINQFWQGETALHITDKAVCTTPGPLAKQLAGNYSRMFAVLKIMNP